MTIDEFLKYAVRLISVAVIVAACLGALSFYLTVRRYYREQKELDKMKEHIFSLCKTPEELRRVKHDILMFEFACHSGVPYTRKSA